MQTTADARATLKQLQRIADRSGNLSGAAVRLYNLAEQDFTQRFKSSPSTTTTAQVYGGVEWKRLSEAYLKSKPKRRQGKQLIDTKELRQSFQRGKPGNIAAATRDTVEFGSSLKKAVWNNDRRPLAPVHRELQERAAAVIQEYVVGKE
jgi:hypothetical protein